MPDQSSLFRQIYRAALTIAFDALRLLFVRKQPLRFISAGQNIRGTIYYCKDNRKAPGVLLLHTALGLTFHEHAMASQLAREGFTALVIGYSKRTSGLAIRDDYRRGQMEQITLDGFFRLQADPMTDAARAAVIGFSMGGYFAVHVGACADQPAPKAVVVYYGMYSAAQTKLATLGAPLLILQGEDDSKDFVKNAKVAEELARQNEKECELILYPGAGHQFDLYEPNSNTTRDAWTRTIEFLRHHLADSLR